MTENKGLEIYLGNSEKINSLKRNCWKVRLSK
jgi:hypothetical protein